MTNHQQAAIEAARTAWDAHFFGPTRNEFDEITCAECGYAFGWDGLGKGPRGDRALNHAFDQALTAAEPHLRHKWIENIKDKMPGLVDDTENAYARGVKDGIYYVLSILDVSGND